MTRGSMPQSGAGGDSNGRPGHDVRAAHPILSHGPAMSSEDDYDGSDVSEQEANGHDQSLKIYCISSS